MDLLIDTFGTKIGSSSERIVLSFPHTKIKKEYPIRRLKKIVILRPASLTTHAVQLALQHEVDIVYLGAFGKPIGRIFSSEPNGLANIRKGQLKVSNSHQSFELAKAFVIGKCTSQINHIKDLACEYKKDCSREIKQAEAALNSVASLPVDIKSKENLFGIEGYIADRYFTCLRKFCKFPRRIPESRDKYNSMLNYAYGILYNEVERACLYVGLDPYLGLYHTERYGKPSLVLDLVEEFRVSVVDRGLFPVFISKEIGKRGYFERVGKGQYQLSSTGKSLVVTAVMKNLNTSHTWKSKRFTVKKIIEQQIQHLARYFVSKESIYQAFYE